MSAFPLLRTFSCWQSQRCGSRVDIAVSCADGSNKLAESLVVVEYLDAKFGGNSPLLPNNPLQLGKVDLPETLFSTSQPS